MDEGIDNVKIVAIGKSQYDNFNTNWTNGNSIPVIVDLSPYNIWSSWGAGQRDLFFLDSNGDYVTDFNITDWNYDAIYDQIVDLIQSMNIPYHVKSVSLLDAYPNPFNPMTNITFSISQSSQSIISVYDLSGRLLEILSQSYVSPGSYTLTWNAEEYASGIYFIKLDTDFISLGQKLILAK